MVGGFFDLKRSNTLNAGLTIFNGGTFSVSAFCFFAVFGALIIVFSLLV